MTSFLIFVHILHSYLQSSDNRTYRLQKGRFLGVRNTIDLCLLLFLSRNWQLCPICPSMLETPEVPCRLHLLMIEISIRVSRSAAASKYSVI